MRKYSIFFVIFSIVILILFGITHENVHQQIYQGYGIKAKIHLISDFPSFTTEAEEPCPTNECNLAHNINEVVGYQLFVLLAAVLIGFLILIKLKEREQENPKEVENDN